MPRSRQPVRWYPACLTLACALLVACASNLQRSGNRDLRLDTESAGKVRHAAAITEAVSPLASAATRTVASTLLQTAPILLTLLESDNAVGELEEHLIECARLAERQVNAQFFGNRPPTRQECGEA